MYTHTHTHTHIYMSAWVAHMVKHLPLAQVMIPHRVLGSSPTLGSLLSGECASPSPTAPPFPALALSLSLTLSQINK